MVVGGGRVEEKVHPKLHLRAVARTPDPKPILVPTARRLKVSLAAYWKSACPEC